MIMTIFVSLRQLTNGPDLRQMEQVSRRKSQTVRGLGDNV